MYRAQMTDTELEAFQMEGEFKPQMDMPELHPSHMTDSELKRVFDNVMQSECGNYTLFDEQVIKEFERRVYTINNRYN